MFYGIMWAWRAAEFETPLQGTTQCDEGLCQMRWELDVGDGARDGVGDSVFGRRGGEDRGLGLCRVEECRGGTTASAIPGHLPETKNKATACMRRRRRVRVSAVGEGECDGGGTTGES
jgi:hypothetical protein